jgi:hypothetical protein
LRGSGSGFKVAKLNGEVEVMKQLIFGAALSMAVAAAPTLATASDGSEDGWGLMYRQDTFDKVEFPMALMQESGSATFKANLFVACGAQAAPIAFFQAGGFQLQAQATPLSFRFGDETIEVTFQPADVPRLQKRLALNEQDTSRLLQMFERADGSAVAYRGKDGQGLFPSIGAKRVFDIVRSDCQAEKS